MQSCLNGFVHIPMSNQFKDKDNNDELPTPYLLKPSTALQDFSKQINLATKKYMNMLENADLINALFVVCSKREDLCLIYILSH